MGEEVSRVYAYVGTLNEASAQSEPIWDRKIKPHK